MHKFNCCSKIIIMWIILVLISEYASASTEISTINNGGQSSWDFAITISCHIQYESTQLCYTAVSKQVMRMILQYLTIRDYLRFTTTNHAQYRAYYVDAPEQILWFLHTQYQSFLTTRIFSDPAEVLLWGQYSDVLRYDFDVTQQILSAQPIMFFTPGTVLAPPILCAAMAKSKTATMKQIQNFFQTYRTTFDNNRLPAEPNVILVGTANPHSTILSFFYDPLDSMFFFWPGFDETTEYFERQLYLPRVLVFTSPEQLHIDRISNWTGKYFEYNTDTHTVVLSWFSSTLRIFLHMKFSEEGFLLAMDTQACGEHREPCGKRIRFRLVEKYGCKYTLDGSPSSETKFTTITAYYYQYPPFQHVQHQSGVDEYERFGKKIAAMMLRKQN